MKLTELEPSWVGAGTSEAAIHCGVSFLCPHCKTQRLVVLFEPVIDTTPEKWSEQMGPMHADKKKWQRQGDTFETLTLSPSIDASESGHWHGFITNGQAL